jgi:hypothetical protein
MEREPFATAIRRVTPPWLQRSVGGRFMAALAEQADTLIARVVDGVLLRFPGATATIDPDALALTGRERRIRRGPGESASTYARRLRTWWDAHRTRGGPYALLGQLRAFFLDWLTVRMDVVYYSGTRRWMDEDGVITRDSITWSASGPSEGWANAWVFMHLPSVIPLGVATLITQDGDTLITQDGDEIVATLAISPSDMTAADEEIFRAIPREWTAAHVPFIRVVLLWSTRRLWNYPQPVPTWSEWGASGALWGEPPVILTTE